MGEQRRLVAAAILAAAVIVGVVYWNGRGSGSRQASPPALDVGAAAPPFVLQGSHGAISSTDYAGRSIMLAFLAPSCHRCAAEVRALGSVAPKLIGPAGARTIYVVTDRTGTPGVARMQRFVESSGVPVGLIVATDTSGRAWRQYGVRALGTVFLIAPGGHVAWRAVDPTAQALRSALRRVNG
jgi:hypothetical protein